VLVRLQSSVPLFQLNTKARQNDAILPSLCYFSHRAYL